MLPAVVYASSSMSPWGREKVSAVVFRISGSGCVNTRMSWGGDWTVRFEGPADGTSRRVVVVDQHLMLDALFTKVGKEDDTRCQNGTITPRVYVRRYSCVENRKRVDASTSMAVYGFIQAPEAR